MRYKTPQSTSFDSKGLFAGIVFFLSISAIVVGLNFVTGGFLKEFASNSVASLRAFAYEESGSKGAGIETEFNNTENSNTGGLLSRKQALSSRIISTKTVEQSVPLTGKFIGADLKAMKLYLYEEGSLIKTFDLQSKGRPGSRWDTPSGQYSILYKNPSHFSSIGEVYMPWSMQFFGNFFIHGWPYYPDGTEVGPGYSGGCIRLSTPDAKEVFQFATIGTAMYVYDIDPEISVDRGPSQLSQFNLPDISAKSFLVADLETGEVFAERNSATQVPIASISKLMTAVVANETISFSRLIPISQNAYNTYGNQGEIQVGEKFTITDLYFPLLLNSSNDAAVAISEYGTGEKYFIKLMNSKAKALEMTDTSYEDPSGLSPNNISTANDLFKLAQYVQLKKRFIFDITMKQSESLTGTVTAPARTYLNNNPMRNRPDFLGGKNGFTDEARKTLLSLFKIKDGNFDRIIAIIVLGSEDHKGDTIKLNEWMNKSLGNSIPLVSDSSQK